ncbi:MAG: SMC-Scp complex subunit ScpB [Oscillospiraceae bacterium]|nr:SMC-Scp complex subunit ScpB [Oscillospiraceae bacterium]
MADITAALEAILFAAGESMPVARLSLVLGTEEKEILQCADELAEEYEKEKRGIRLLHLGDKLQLCSAPEYAPYITKALEQRKPPMLSPSALETLAIVAYFQPVTRAYIDQVRGVDSSYTVSTLLERGLIEPAGKLDVPGRPSLLRTTDVFLRIMSVSSLEELPKLPDMSGGDGVMELQRKIEQLQNAENGGEQLSLSEIQSSGE